MPGAETASTAESSCNPQGPSRLRRVYRSLAKLCTAVQHSVVVAVAAMQQPKHTKIHTHTHPDVWAVGNGDQGEQKKNGSTDGAGSFCSARRRKFNYDKSTDGGEME